MKRWKKHIVLLIIMLAGTWQLLPVLRAQNQYLFIISDNGKYGYIDSSGRVCIQPVYLYGTPTATDEVVVKNKKKRWGVIDASGKTVLPFRYSFIYYHKPGIVTRAERKNKTGEVNKAGHFIDFPGNDIERVSGDFTANDAPTPFCNKNRQWGYLGSKGKISIAAQYESAGSFFNGLAPVKQNGKYGYISTNGQFIIQPVYDYASAFAKQGNHIVAVVRKNNLFYLIDEKEKLFFDTGFSSLNLPAEKQWGSFTKNGKLGFIDPRLNIRINAEFDSATSSCFSTDHWIIPVKKENKWGFIDTTGRFVITPEYEDASTFENGRAWVKQNGRYAIITLDGKRKSDFEFTSYRHTLPGTTTFLLAARESQWLVFDYSLKQKITVTCDELRDGGRGLILVRKQQRWGVISAEGKTLVPVEFGEIQIHGQTISCYSKSAAESLVPDAYFNSAGELLWLKSE